MAKINSEERDAISALNQKKDSHSYDQSSATESGSRPSAFHGRDSSEESEDKPSTAETEAPAPKTPREDVSKLQMVADGARRQAQEEFKAAQEALQEQLENAQRDAAEAKALAQQKEQDIQKARDDADRDQELLIKSFYRGRSPLDAVTEVKDAANSSSKGAPWVSRTYDSFHQSELLKEYNRIIDRDSASFTTYTPNGELIEQKDTRYSDSFYREHRKALMLAVQDEMKTAGYLRGGVTSVGRDNTTPADIPYAFLDIASAEGRLTHHEANIYWQFARRISDPSINVEQTGRFPRHVFGASSTSISDYVLGSSVGSLQTTTESVRANTVPIEILEYGLGKPGTDLMPISVHEVVTSNNIFDAFQAVNRNLVKSYNRFEDLAIRSLLHSTTRGGYVSDDGLVETAAEVTVGGAITEKFLATLYAEMSAQNIPALSDGCYILVMPPQSIAALKKDLLNSVRYVAEPDFERMSALLSEYHGDSGMKRHSGYQGKVGNFHIYQSNSHGVGIPGTEGVQTETLNGVSVTTRNCYAFGIDPVGVIDAMPFTIRQKSEGSYGRKMDFIWISHQGYGALDVDPLRVGGSASEQLRVFDIRCSDIAV